MSVSGSQFPCDPDPHAIPTLSLLQDDDLTRARAWRVLGSAREHSDCLLYNFSAFSLKAIFLAFNSLQISISINDIVTTQGLY